MTSKQKRSLILASIIGTIFSTYKDEERTKLHDELHRRIGKGVRKQVKLHSEEAVKIVAHDEGNKLWSDTVDHFSSREITIEASSCILAMWNLDEKALSKHYGLGAGKLGRWATPSKRSDAAELEKASREVAKYVFDSINDLYAIEVEKDERFRAHKTGKGNSMSLAEAIFGRMDDNESKNPLYYRHHERIDKKNKELKRSLNTMRKMKDDGTTAELLSKKDLVAFEKGLVAYGVLLHKRERASQDNKNREAKKIRKEERGARWIRSSFERVDIEFMLKIIYVKRDRTIWSFYEDSIEDVFMLQLRDWGIHMETREDATKHVEALYKAMSDTNHPAYKKWEENVKNGLKEYKETIA